MRRTLPALGRIPDGVVDHRRDRRLDQAKGHVLRARFGAREAEQPFGARKAAVARVFAAAKRQALVQVGNAKVVDVDHAALELRCNVEAQPALRAKDGRAEAERRAVRDAHRFVDRVVDHDQKDRRKELLVGNLHVRRDVRQERRRKVVAKRPAGVRKAAAAVHERRAVRDCVLNQRLELPEARIADHCAAVHRVLALGREAEARLVERAAAAQRGDAVAHDAYELVGHRPRHDEALDPDAVLAHRLETCTEEHRRKEREVRAGENHRGVLPAELKRRRGELRRSSERDFAADQVAADKRNVREARVARERLGVLGRTYDDLHEVLGEAARRKAAAHRGEDVPRGPRDVLRALDHDRVTSKQRRDHRAQHVVHRVVPRDACGDHAERLVHHRAPLVRQQKIAAALLRTQHTLAVGDRPLELGTRREQLAKGRIDRRLAGVAAGDARDHLHVAQDPCMDRAQELAALLPRRRAPCALRRRGLRDLGIDRFWGIRRKLIEDVAGGRVVAKHLAVGDGRRRRIRTQRALPARLRRLGVNTFDLLGRKPLCAAERIGCERHGERRGQDAPRSFVVHRVEDRNWALFHVPTMDPRETARATFEVQNEVVTLDAETRAIYAYDAEAYQKLLRDAPWRDDVHYFQKVRISVVALMKMVLHARLGGALEVMGLMQGTVCPDTRTFYILDAFALPVHGTETRVNAQNEAYEYMIQYLDQCSDVRRPQQAVGWYHSHPGYRCWLSGIDVETQQTNQRQDPFVAVVVRAHTHPDRSAPHHDGRPGGHRCLSHLPGGLPCGRAVNAAGRTSVAQDGGVRRACRSVL